MNTIVIVEDEVKIAGLLADYLKAAGYETVQVHDGGMALEVIREQDPVMVLLDLMLPNKDGLEICRELRRRSEVPVIMITAKVEEVDRLIGLEIGADDYVCKPFSPREVVARVKAILRRSSGSASDVDGITLDESRLEVSHAGKTVTLTQVEFRLLTVLVGRGGKILSRKQLMDLAYDDHRIVSDRTVDSHIKKIRQRLRELDAEHEFIRSVYGAGYLYQAPGVDEPA